MIIVPSEAVRARYSTAVYGSLCTRGRRAAQPAAEKAALSSPGLADGGTAGAAAADVGDRRRGRVVAGGRDVAGVAVAAGVEQLHGGAAAAGGQRGAVQAARRLGRRSRRRPRRARAAPRRGAAASAVGRRADAVALIVRRPGAEKLEGAFAPASRRRCARRAAAARRPRGRCRRGQAAGAPAGRRRPAPAGRSSRRPSAAAKRSSAQPARATASLEPAALAAGLVGVEQRRRDARLVGEQRRAIARPAVRGEEVGHAVTAARHGPEVGEHLRGAVGELGTLEQRGRPAAGPAPRVRSSPRRRSRR